MSESNERKRKPNFSDEELVAMVMAVTDRKEQLLSKFDSKITAKTKQLAWSQVTEEVNNVSSGGVIREVQEVRKKFADFRGIVKKKAAGDRKYSGGTGGGPAKHVQYTPAEEAMLPLIERTAIHGLNVPESKEPAASFHGSAASVVADQHLEGTEEQEDLSRQCGVIVEFNEFNEPIISLGTGAGDDPVVQYFTVNNSHKELLEQSMGTPTPTSNVAASPAEEQPSTSAAVERPVRKKKMAGGKQSQPVVNDFVTDVLSTQKSMLESVSNMEKSLASIDSSMQELVKVITVAVQKMTCMHNS